MQKETYKVILFYKFEDIEDTELLMKVQRELCESLGLKGRMLIAAEGINATFEGTPENIDKYKARLLEDERFKDIVFKESESDGEAFTKLKIKVRDEIVTLGAGRFDVQAETAEEITAEELQNMYERGEDFVVLDLRNDFEIEAGYFDKTVNPNLENFRDLPGKIQELQKGINNKKVVAVCTGGIRCEKATCLLKKEGFDNIYQLKDGIHTYIQKYPGKHFKGSLFVFDNRMTTAVVETPEREIVGKCLYCGEKCEDFYSDESSRPSRKIICCTSCFSKQGSNLRTCIPTI